MTVADAEWTYVKLGERIKNENKSKNKNPLDAKTLRMTLARAIVEGFSIVNAYIL